MTPDEARNMDCPMSMALPGYNRHCLATKCMAWRWDWIIDPKDPRAYVPSTTDGYCGMVKQ